MNKQITTERTRIESMSGVYLEIKQHHLSRRDFVIEVGDTRKARWFEVTNTELHNLAEWIKENVPDDGR